MQFAWRGSDRWPALFVFAAGVGALTGCASPAAPRAPSLQLPEFAPSLSAMRSGDVVRIRFQTPAHTTDGQPLKGSSVTGNLCRQDVPGGPCHPVDTGETSAALPLAGAGGEGQTVLWTDTLPPALRTGPVRPVSYRVTLKNEQGKSAGPSDAVYAAAGSAPPPVEEVRPQGVRQGVLLAWQPRTDAGEVLLERTQLDPKPQPARPASQPVAEPHSPKSSRKGHLAKAERKPAAHPQDAPGTQWLTVTPEGAALGKTIDGTVDDGTTYRYTAIRRMSAHVGGRTLELRSQPSTPVEITWRDIHPPAPPDGLTGIAYYGGQAAEGQPAAGGNKGGYAVDLVWQPVNDPRVSGYVVTRQELAPGGAAQGQPERLTPTPVTTPAFHDATALPGVLYRYEVSSTDAQRNTSQPTTVVVQPSQR